MQASRRRVIILLAAAGWALSIQTHAAERPNVLFLAIDDLNDWTGFLKGHPQAKTPNLDRLAARGVTFTRAYCSAPACNPSRASLMCGVRPSTSGVYLNSQPWRPVLKDAVTLSQHFMKNGYVALGCGKIFHGAYKDRSSWHQYFARPAGPRPKRRPVNTIRPASHFDWGPVEADDAAMGDAHVVDWAVKHLARKHEEPMFLAVGLFRPHLPWYVPKKYFDLFPLAEIQLPKTLLDDLGDVPAAGRAMAKPRGDHRKVTAAGQWKQAVQGYLASIAFADAQVGRLLDALDSGPYADNTIVVMWGDHGWHLGEKKHWRKFSLWEEADRVPLLIYAPGVTKAGSRCGRTVSLLDLYPTLIDLCGLPKKDRLEGRSLSPLLANVDAPWNRPVVTTHGRLNHAVRSERWRYIRYRDGSEELYDHDVDPLEWKNLAGEVKHAGVKRELAAWLPKVNAADAPAGRRKLNRKQGRKREGKKSATSG